MKKTISGTFLRWLLLIVGVAFAVSMVFSWSLQTRLSKKSAVNLLRLNIADVRQDVIDASDANLLNLTRTIASEIDGGAPSDVAGLSVLMTRHDVAEINVINTDGIIISTTHPDFLEYDMRTGRQSAEFLGLLDGTETEHVQSYQPISYDSSLLRKYAGVCLKDGGFVQVAYDADRFQRDIDHQIIGVTRNRHVGENGCIIIAGENWNIVSDRNHNEGKNLYATGIWIDRPTMPEGEVFISEVYGETCSCMYVFTEGYYIIAALPENEILLQRDTSVLLTAGLEVLVFLALFAVIFLLVHKLVVNNINRVNSSLSKITDGDLEEKVDVRSNTEFASLSDDINATVSTLKQYISAAAARIDQELAFAKNIQQSALPSVFPPYPDRKDFSLFAAMDTAKEVGGDFYDFYFLDENRLAFLVADVSGKGIPAAMFMMTGKTVLRDYAERGDAPADVARFANEKLCEGNDAEMFITSWMGFLETDTGLVRFINAGHNAPVLIRNGHAEFIKQKVNLALAAMDGVPYREQSLQLMPGDLLYLYTDGVTEAENASEELFGNARLLSVLSGPSGKGEAACRNVCARVKTALKAFTGDAAQFDDITMLCLYYAGTEADEAFADNVPAPDRESAENVIGPDNSEAETVTAPADSASDTVTVPASAEHLAEVIAFVEAKLNGFGCSERIKQQITVAAEEIFVNIAHYAYGDAAGNASVSVRLEQGDAVLTFRDRGTPFNPLEKDDPDITLGADERPIGGLGIFMVKKSMDEVRYERDKDENVLTIRKRL
ncbi:MAG: SpoIIE family protein phosphatase [Lachnospiraceae bacterium]|nr:SpoIIE family protein phosphatase [Lachnospiraceae bacterium]